jgi:3-hydroxybutyryl-CoA dehydrogenase
MQAWSEMTEQTIGIIGSGTMGSGIAIVALQAGFNTRVLETDGERLNQGIDRIRSFLEDSVVRGKMTVDKKEEAVNRLAPTVRIDDLADCDYIIEAIFEEVDVKRKLFGQLDLIVDKNCLFLSNTSTLSVTSIARGCGREDKVVGMHFCNPAALMKLVEITKGLLTSEESMARTKELAGRLGKVFVITNDTPGFILNYLLIPFENDCIRALESGLASVEDIDKAVKLGLGYPMGTFELLDTIGLDLHYQVSMRLYEQLHDARFSPPPLVTRMIDANLLGRKTGHGFYDYDHNGGFGS